MAFHIRFSDSPSAVGYGDEDIYEFLGGGVLAVRFGDPAKWSEYYPSHRWEQVISEVNHPPGTVYGESEGALAPGD